MGELLEPLRRRCDRQGRLRLSVVRRLASALGWACLLSPAALHAEQPVRQTLGAPQSLGASQTAAARHEPSPAEIAVARQLFHQAEELREAGRWSEAAEKLRAALAIKETAGLRIHLGHCLEQLGQLVAALNEYDRAEELVRQGQAAPDAATALEPARAALSARLPALTVTLPARIAEADVQLDGAPLAPAMLGQRIPVDPGRHRLVVQARGYRRYAVDVELEEGQSRALVPRLEREVLPASSQAGAARSTEAKGGVGAASGRRAPALHTAVFLTEAGLTLVGLGVGIGFTLAGNAAESSADTYRSRLDAVAPGNPTVCHNPQPELAGDCRGLAEAVADRSRSRDVAVVGFVGAAVGGLALLATELLWDLPSKPRRRTGTTAAWSAQLGSDRLLLGVRGSF